MPMEGMSLRDIQEKVRSMFGEQFKGEEKDGTPIDGPYIEDVFLDDMYVIVEKKGKEYKVNFDKSYKFQDESEWEAGNLKSQWVPEGQKDMDEGKDETEGMDETEKESYEMAKELKDAK